MFRLEKELGIERVKSVQGKSNVFEGIEAREA